MQESTITITNEYGPEGVPNAHLSAFSEWLGLLLRNGGAEALKVHFPNDQQEDGRHVIFVVRDESDFSAFTEDFWLRTDGEGAVFLYGSEDPTAPVLLLWPSA